jgi:hypothetical protein
MLTNLLIYDNNKLEDKMTEITVKLKDELIKEYGKLFIQNFVEQQLEHLELFREMDEIEQEIKDSNMDYEKELENIREKAWQEYKKDYFD